MTEPFDIDANRGAQPVAAAPEFEPVAPPPPPRPSAPAETPGGQTQLAAYAAATERPAAPQQEPISPERRAEIDAFVDANANASESSYLIFSDNVGGERVGAALRGQSDLGRLSGAEQDYLAERAVAKWDDGNAYESVREAGDAVSGNAEAERALAGALANRAAEKDVTAEGQEPTNNRRTRSTRASEGRFADQLRETAFETDPAAAADAYQGQEVLLGRELMDMPREIQRDVFQAVANREINGESADRLVSSMFVYADAADLRDAGNQRAMADALAMTAQPSTHPTPSAERQIIANRLNDALSTSGGRELLFNENVNPDVRGWALENVMHNPEWTGAALENGWESDVVTLQLGEQAAAQYAQRGTEARALTGDALRNTVGQALGEQPDRLPPENETAAERQARLDAGLDHNYYTDESRAAAVASVIEREGGEGAKVSVVPVSVTSNEFGVANFNVFRVERADDTVIFVDDKGQRYRDFDHWQSKNELPPGRMTHPAGLEPGAELIEPENTRAVVDTFWEHAGRVLDWTAMGVGVVAGAALVVGTGGTAAIVAAGVAGAYTAGRAGAEIYDEAERGVDVFDMSNPENRSRWLEVAAGTLSVGAIGSGLRVAHLSSKGAQVSTALSRTAAGLAIAGDTADAIAMTDQAIQLTQNWDQMSNGDRAAGLLNIAFWAGMGAASAKAGGADLQDAFSFTRLDNTFRTGTPYPMAEVPGMAPGEIRVAYNENGGRARDIRIETGGNVDRADLQRHTETARQMEAAGGLSDRLRAMVGNEQPPVGSAAWEAQLEIGKINAEAADIATQLAQPDLSATQKSALELRQQELNDAINVQTERLNEWGTMGEGWVAAPHRGAQQAQAKGYPEAPDGYTWVAGSDGEPHLRDLTGADQPLRYDQTTQTFIPREGAAPVRTVNNGSGQGNEANWQTDGQGRLTEVTATLREYHVNAGRTRDELAAQAEVRARGVDTDDAGHAVGHRFVLDNGVQNLFPQDANFNRGAYKTLENEMADWIAAGGEVELTVRPGDYVDGRPESVEIEYIVRNANGEKCIGTTISLTMKPGNPLNGSAGTRLILG